MADLRIHLKIPDETGLATKLLEHVQELQLLEDKAARREQRLSREISVQEAIIKICSAKFCVEPVIPKRGRPYREENVS